MSIARSLVFAGKNRLALLFGFLLFAGVARSRTYAVFNAPGAVSTDAYSMNDAGTVTGVYADVAGKTHSFVRMPARQIIAFERTAAGAHHAISSGVRAITLSGRYRRGCWCPGAS